MGQAGGGNKGSCSLRMAGAPFVTEHVNGFPSQINTPLLMSCVSLLSFLIPCVSSVILSLTVLACNCASFFSLSAGFSSSGLLLSPFFSPPCGWYGVVNAGAERCV
ncbi:unnamed protein product [Discosporangium mesarthrocarpum]